MPDFKMLLETKEYEFLKTEPRLGRRILLLGLGGSYAYGTANENSDIDFRGVTLNLPSDLLGLTEFEQYEDQHTDTVIYSFNKMVRLLLECNPNTCEILGLEPDEYLILSPLGRELLERKKNFSLQAGRKILRRLCQRTAAPSSECHCQKFHAATRAGTAYS